MQDLVPIKVLIGLRPNGYVDHPDWSQLPLAATENPKDHMQKQKLLESINVKIADLFFIKQFYLVPSAIIQFSRTKLD